MSIRGRLRSSHSSEEQYRLGECRKCGRHSANQSLITCSLCEIQYHPKCLSMDSKFLTRKQSVQQWSCHKCRNCVYCGKKSSKAGPKSVTGALKMIACVQCDRSAHPLCIDKFDKSGDNQTNTQYVCHKCRDGTPHSNHLSTDSANEEEEEGSSDDSIARKTSADEADSDDAGVVSDDEEEQEDSSDAELSPDDLDVTNEVLTDNTKHNERPTTQRRTGRSGPQRLTRSMTKHSPQESKTDENNDSKETADESDNSEDNENMESNTRAGISSEGLGRTAKTVNGKKKRKKRGRGSASYKARMSTKSVKTGESDAECRPPEETASDMDEPSDGKCCVPDCDSTGHLSGKFESHSTLNTCPVYHNLTPDDCRNRYLKRIERRSEKNGSEANKRELRTKTNTNSPNKEDKCLALMESRRKDMHKELANNNSPNKTVERVKKQKTSSREPDLKGLTPIFDLEMFREAQARAAELIQEQLCGEQTVKRTGIRLVEMGRYEMCVHYSSPYPEEYQCLPKLYICEFCLNYMNSPLILKRHLLKCVRRYPPGDEIYRKGNLSFFEVDGDKNKQFCVNLCLLAKLFLDHKTLYFDVEPFLFYIMTEADAEGCHIIGYFSKEKQSFLSYNVSCILTLPPYQRQGFGKMLIDFSYLLTKTEGKVGSPEKPLSDLGLISYRSYWKQVILEYLCSYQANDISIKDVSQQTGINAYDIVSTLQSMGMLKYWKGKHLVLTKKDILDEFRAKLKKKKNPKLIDPKCLHWTPKYSQQNT